jgi:pimeloyl-ACP methyl ester carboxylesterase
MVKNVPGQPPPAGAAPALKTAGFTVFTAPVQNGSTSLPTSCATTPQPPSNAVLNSHGEVDANGTALNVFLSYLHSTYNVGRVTLVGHSDGGLWSRAAIATHQGSPTIDGLITIGTPHTGSFVADLGVLVNDVPCTSVNGGSTGQGVCSTFQSLANALVLVIGPTAIEELTSQFLQTWNKQRTTERCTVTAIQGTAVNPLLLPPPQPLLSSYYSPSDAIVGQASAANQPSTALDGSKIPAAQIRKLAVGPSFPDFHTPDFGRPSELNDPSLDNALVTELQRRAVPCHGKVHSNRVSKLALPFYSATGAGATSATGPAPLPNSGTGDVVLTGAQQTLSCGNQQLTASPLIPQVGGFNLLSTFIPGPCSQLSAGPGTSGSNATALMFHLTRSSAKVSLHGNSLTVNVKPAGSVASLVAQVEVGTATTFTTIPLDKHGRGTIPTGPNPVVVVLTGTLTSGTQVIAIAPMAR